MSKKQIETLEARETKRGKFDWIKSPLLPWIIIILSLTFMSGVWYGWTERSSDSSRVESKVMSIIKDVKIELLKESE